MQTMPHVLILQHVRPETPGLIGEALDRRGVEVQIVRIHEGEPVPEALGAAAGLVVMGGPMGVYEQDAYPHLKSEHCLIEAALHDAKPVLGVCLGSQLLAAVLGAQVRPGPRKEIGWHDVRLTEEATRDALWKGVDRPFTAFHWHGDVFDLPRGAVSLARSEQTVCQAFRYGSNAYGFLFHLEVTPEIIRGMTQAFAGELAEEGLSGEAIRQEAERYLPRLEETGRAVFGRWAALLDRTLKRGRFAKM